VASPISIARAKGAFEGFEGDPGRRFLNFATVGDAGPAQWAASLRTVDRDAPLPGFSQDRWVQAINDGLIFLEGWGSQVMVLGWPEESLFGVHPFAPARRFDCMGLALLLAGGRVTTLTADLAIINSPRGSTLSHRRPLANLKNLSLWHLQNLQKELEAPFREAGPRTNMDHTSPGQGFAGCFARMDCYRPKPPAGCQQHKEKSNDQQ
jgi:hypothetical protein